MFRLSLSSKLMIPFLGLILLIVLNDFYLSKQILILSRYANQNHSALSSIPPSLMRTQKEMLDLYQRLQRLNANSQEDLEQVLSKIDGHLSENLIRLESLESTTAISNLLRLNRDLYTNYVGLSHELLYAIHHMKSLGHKASQDREIDWQPILKNLKFCEDQLLSLIQKLQNLVDQERQEIKEREDRLLFNSTWLSFGILLICLLFSYFVYAQLKPLRQMKLWVEGWLKGENHSDLAIKGSDELRELGLVLNEMSKTIQERTRDLAIKQQQALHQARLVTVGKLVAQITHELRNPLSSIGLNSELLMDEIEGLGNPQQIQDAKVLLGEIAKEIERLKEITEAYLHFARLPRPNFQMIDLNHLVQEVSDFVRAECQKVMVQIQLDLEQVSRKIRLDPNQIRSALLNVLRNAKESLIQKGGGRILVKVRSFGDYALIEIQDNGSGFSLEAIEHQFEPFFSTKPQGTGLGLAMVQQIMMAHQGKIEISNQSIHLGAIVKLSFPIHHNLKIPYDL